MGCDERDLSLAESERGLDGLHDARPILWREGEAILQHGNNSEPLVLIKETTQREFEGGTQIFIYAQDQHDFFAVTVAAMAQLNLNIHDARILTSTSQFTLDTYIVLEGEGGSIGDNPARIKQIRQGLIDALKNPDEYPVPQGTRHGKYDK